MESQAILKRMLRSVSALEDKVEILQAEMKNLKRTKKEIIAQCSIPSNAACTFARYVNKKVLTGCRPFSDRGKQVEAMGRTGHRRASTVFH